MTLLRFTLFQCGKQAHTRKKREYAYAESSGKNHAYWRTDRSGGILRSSFPDGPTFDGAGHDYASGAVTLTKVTSPAIPVEAIGAIDAIVLSHDQHPDNLDTAHAFPGALIIPIHTEGWAHYTQSAQELEAAFGALGMSHRLRVIAPGESFAFVKRRSLEEKPTFRGSCS